MGVQMFSPLTVKGESKTEGREITEVVTSPWTHSRLFYHIMQEAKQNLTRAKLIQ